jgi:hypothetical protein
MRTYTLELLMKEFDSTDRFHYTGTARCVTPDPKKQKKLCDQLFIDPSARTMTGAEQASCDFA